MSIKEKYFELCPNKWLNDHNFLAKKQIAKLYYPPYLLDLAPCNFCLFPNMKTTIKARRFSDVFHIQKHVTKILKSILEEFQKCFEQWQHNLTKYIMVQGDYSEGDNNYQFVNM